MKARILAIVIGICILLGVASAAGMVSPDVEQRPTEAAPAASAISVGKYVQ